MLRKEYWSWLGELRHQHIVRHTATINTPCNYMGGVDTASLRLRYGNSLDNPCGCGTLLYFNFDARGYVASSPLDHALDKATHIQKAAIGGNCYALLRWSLHCVRLTFCAGLCRRNGYTG